MSNGILVFIENKGGTANRSSFEAIAAAQAFGSQLQQPVSAVVLGSDVAGLAQEIAAYDIARVIAVNDPKLAEYTPDAYADALEQVEVRLAKAVEANPMFAAAHAALAEVRAELKRSAATIAPHMQKAVALEPSSPWHRILAARTLARLGAIDEARKAAESALKLADDDASAKAEAERLLARFKQ